MKTFILILIGSYSISCLTGCGTISGAISKGKRPVYLIETPNNLQVSVNGEKKEITREAFAAYNISTDISTTQYYYTNAVMLPYKKKATLELESGGKTVTVDLKPKIRPIYYVANIFMLPPAGHLIDFFTKNNRELYPRYIDVPAVLAGKSKSEWRSKGKLKRLAKRMEQTRYY